MTTNFFDLSTIRHHLEPIFQRYPVGNFCDVCAVEIGKVLVNAGHNVEIATIQNEEVPGTDGMRPEYIHALKSDGSTFLLGKTGFHQANRILQGGEIYYLDALVYLHYGAKAVDADTYFGLFLYSDGVEITKIQNVS